MSIIPESNNEFKESFPDFINWYTIPRSNGARKDVIINTKSMKLFNHELKT